MFTRRFASVILITVFMAGTCAARKPGEPLKPGFNLFSKQQDIEIGQETSKQVLKQYQEVNNKFLQNYLKRIGERLARAPQAAQSGFPFSFTLLNDKSVNAFALPGGPMFVFTGLIADADNEGELAGAMAHEMSHVILRHGTNQASKANLLQLPALLAGAAIGNGSLTGQLAQLGIGLGLNSVLLKFSRTDESQADALGAHIMAEAGYNPIELARFFEKLQAGGGSRGPQFLSDHPNPGNREKAIEDEIRTMPQRSYGYRTGEFERAKALVKELPAPPAKTPSAAGNNANPPSEGPSGSFRQLNGRNFSVSYPSNWQTFGDSNSAMITIAPREGLVQSSNGGSSVGYGVILSYFFPDNNTRKLRDATNDLIHHMRADNPGIQVTTSNPRQLKVNGSEALVTMLSSNSPYGGDETDALLTVQRPEGVFYMVFIAPSRSYRGLQNTFQHMLDSIRFQQ